MARRSIPAPVRRAVLLEAAYRCGNPRCRHVLTLELHHIVWVRDGGGNVPENLIALCPNCHSLHTAGHIPAEAVQSWKGVLVSLNNPHRVSADLLLVLFREEERISAAQKAGKLSAAFRFTGDGLGFLSGLLTAGLIEIEKRSMGVAWYGGGMPSFTVRLTDSGRALVDAWLSGSAEELETALRMRVDRGD